MTDDCPHGFIGGRECPDCLRAEIERLLDAKGRMRVDLANAQAEIARLTELHVAAAARAERAQIEAARLRRENKP